MPIDDFLNTTQPPPMGPADLGLPALPPPPQVPQQPQRGGGLMQTIMQAVPGILGGAMGPGAGTGLLQGAVMGQQRNDQQARLDHQEAMQAYQWQQRAYEEQAQQYGAATRQREQIIQQTLTSLREQVGKAPDKAAYDGLVEAYGRGLQSMGYRLDANWLRKTVPYAAPKSEALASTLIDNWMKMPNNKDLLDKHPEQAATAILMFDRDGDGQPEKVTLRDLATLAGRPMAMDESGKLLFSPVTGLSAEDKAGVDARYQDLVAIAEAEGKDVKSNSAEAAKLRNTLRDQAIADAAKATPKGPEHPAGTLPPRTQTRVDAKSRGFDALPIVKTTQKMAEAVSFAQSLDPNTTNPADDQALIYAFAKAMDPDSVVREGEYATVQKYAQSWAQTYGFNVARIFSNTAFLTPQARANLKKTIIAKYAAGKSQYDNVRREYARQIDKITGEPGSGEEWLTDYAGAFPASEPSAPKQTTSGPKVGERRKFGDQLGEWDGQGWMPVEP